LSRKKILFFDVKPEHEKKVYIPLLIITLILCWVIYDLVYIKTETFRKAEEFHFGAQTAIQIKDKIKQDIKRFQSSTDMMNQIGALVHMLESNYYLLYNRQRSMSRYYDFIKIVLYPPLRKQLKNKSSYIRQGRRYLKRKRNLEIKFSGYQISYPSISSEIKGNGLEVLVRRLYRSTSGKEDEFFVYHFKRHSDNRFYLYFTDPQSNRIRYKFLEDRKTKEDDPNDNENK
jgi:hypothetical protein